MTAPSLKQMHDMDNYYALDTYTKTHRDFRVLTNDDNSWISVYYSEGVAIVATKCAFMTYRLTNFIVAEDCLVMTDFDDTTFRVNMCDIERVIPLD